MYFCDSPISSNLKCLNYNVCSCYKSNLVSRDLCGSFFDLNAVKLCICACLVFTASGSCNNGKMGLADAKMCDKTSVAVDTTAVSDTGSHGLAKFLRALVSSQWR